MRGLVVGALGLVVAAGAGAVTGCKGAAKPKPGPTCATASAAIARGMVKVRADIATAGIDPAPELAVLCVEDAWASEVVACYAAAAEPRGLRACSARLSSDQRLHARALQENVYRRASEVGEGGGSGLGIAACDAYFGLAERYAGCDQVSEAVRDAFTEEVMEQRMRWGDAGDDDSSREAIERECVSLVQIMDQRIDGSGC